MTPAAIVIAVLALGDPRSAIESAEREAADAARPIEVRRAAAERALTLRDEWLATLEPGAAVRASLLVETAWAHLDTLSWDATDTAALVASLDPSQAAARTAAQTEDWSLRPPRFVGERPLRPKPCDSESRKETNRRG